MFVAVKGLDFESRKLSIKTRLKRAMRNVLGGDRGARGPRENRGRSPVWSLRGGGAGLAAGADPDEATQTGIGLCRLGCFVGAGARSQRSSRLLAMTMSRILASA
jgi:hypothetical protein